MRESGTTKERVLQQLREAYALLHEKHQISREEILRELGIEPDKETPEELAFPVTVFSKHLSSLETITKYLKENQNIPLPDIAKKLNRNYRTIWGAYHAAQKKHPTPLSLSPTPYRIPLAQFSERNLSVLETLTHYLRTHYQLRYSQIARVLHRDPRTIWTTEHKAKLKLK